MRRGHASLLPNGRITRETGEITMAALKPLLLIVGILGLLAGLLFVGQGAGYINWPESSAMIGQSQWTTRGAIIAIVGVGMIWMSRRISA